MEYLDPSYKKKHTILLFIGYGLFGVIISLLALLFALEASGYYINRGGEILQNSLLFVNSDPDRAQIYVNGKLEGANTNAKLVLPEGKHTVEIYRSGFRTWKKDIQLEGGVVTFATYPYLFPDNTTSKAVAAYPEIKQIKQSPNQENLAVYAATNPLLIDIYNLSAVINGTVAPTKIDMSALDPLLGVAVTSVEIQDWSNDNRSMLLSVVGADGLTTYWVVDFENPTIFTPVPLPVDHFATSVEFVNGRPNVVDILLSTGELLRVNLSEKTNLSVALGVLAYDSFGDGKVMYAKASSDKTKIDVIISSDLDEWLLTTLPVVDGDHGQLQLHISQFSDDELYVVGSSVADRLKTYKNPLQSLGGGESPTVVSNVGVVGLSSVKFSGKSRFVAAKHDGGLIVYDAEDNKPYRYEIPGLADNYEITWMDDHRLYGVIDEKVQVWEFDSLNMVSLDIPSTGPKIYFDKDYDTITSISTNAAGATDILLTNMRP